MAMSDYAEILRLCFTYPEYLDAGDFQAVGRLLEHGSLKVLGDEVSGAEDIATFYFSSVHLFDGSPRTKHVLTNAIVDVDDDGTNATCRSYFQVLQALPDFPLQIIAAGRYVDTFAKSDDGWRFVEKQIRADFTGDASRHVIGYQG